MHAGVFCLYKQGFLMLAHIFHEGNGLESCMVISMISSPLPADYACTYACALLLLLETRFVNNHCMYY